MNEEQKWEIIPMEVGYFRMPWSRFILDNTAAKEENARVYAFPVICFLLHNEEAGENVLLDCGADHRYPEQYKAPEVRVPGYSMRPVSEALQKLRIDPESIRKVYISHLHGDHIGGGFNLPNAQFIVQRKEVQYAVTHEYFHPSSLLQKRPSGPFFEEYIPRMELVDGNVDFGNGIRAFLIPGHTDGSQGFLVNSTEGPRLFPGDIMYLKENWERKKPAGNIKDHVKGYKAVRQIQKIAEETGAVVVPAHDIRTLHMFSRFVTCNEIPEDVIGSL